MKYFLRFSFFTILVCSSFICPKPSFMQSFMVQAIPIRQKSGCVKISMITIADELELKKWKPTSVTVRIENTSGKDVELRHEPVFNFERIGIQDENRNRMIFGDFYTGRLPEMVASNSRTSIVRNGDVLEFSVKLTDLELRDAKSSFAQFENIFQVLKKGSYTLEAEVVLNVLKREKENFENCKSNRIKVKYDDFKFEDSSK